MAHDSETSLQKNGIFSFSSESRANSTHTISSTAISVLIYKDQDYLVKQNYNSTIKLKNLVSTRNSRCPVIFFFF